MSMRNQKFAEHLGNKIGKFVEVDQTDLLIPSKTVKIRVDCDLSKPLRRGLMLRMNNVPTWFKMKYIKLPNFCYACGLLGHVYRCCELYDARVPEAELQYGAWIRASPTKKKTKETEKEILQERQRLLNLCGSGNRVKAKGKLNFEKSMGADMNID